jgi:arylformamidase
MFYLYIFATSMEMILLFNGNEIKLNSNRFYDLSIPIQKNTNVNCYHLESPAFSYYDSPEFCGSLDKGGSVNCEKMSFYAHASGTHTECALHVLKTSVNMLNISLPLLIKAKLITVKPSEIGEDKVINAALFEGVLDNTDAKAIVIRTIPNSIEKRTHNYSSTNPPFIHTDAISLFNQLGFEHLITDLPSIDKEQDGGLLAAHKLWFGDGTAHKTITELIYAPDDIPDGDYFVSIQAPKIETDAVPSKILLYSCF